MQGDPRYFESIGNRLGFRIERQDRDRLSLIWRGALFPGLLCLGISLALLFLTVPVVQAIQLHGLSSRVGSLWYFPLMNLLLASVAFFLISLKRTIVLDRIANTVSMTKRSLWTRRSLTVEFPEIAGLRLGTDQVYGGFAVAGSTAGVKSFPASSLRLVLSDGETVLLDRGGKKRLGELADLLGRFLAKPVAESQPSGRLPCGEFCGDGGKGQNGVE